MSEDTTPPALNNPPARSNTFLSSRTSSSVTEWEAVTLSSSSPRATIHPNETIHHGAGVPPLSESSALATFAREELPRPPQPPTLSRAPTVVLQHDEPTLSRASTVVLQHEPPTLSRAPTVVLQHEPLSRAPTVVLQHEPPTLSRAPTVVLQHEPPTLSRAPTLVLQHDEPTLQSEPSNSPIISPQPGDEVDAEMLHLVQDLAKKKDIPDWKPRVTQLPLPGLMESRVWISDAYTASRMSSLEVGPCQRVAHVLFLCEGSLAERVKSSNPALTTCEDYPKKHFAPKDLLDPDVLDDVCSWISRGTKGSDAMNHAVLLVSATGCTYAPAMALAYQIWGSVHFVPDINQLVDMLSDTDHVVSLDFDCIGQLTIWRDVRNVCVQEMLSYGRVESQGDVLEKDDSWFWEGKCASPKRMAREDSGASEYVW